MNEPTIPQLAVGGWLACWDVQFRVATLPCHWSKERGTEPAYYADFEPRFMQPQAQLNPSCGRARRPTAYNVRHATTAAPSRDLVDEEKCQSTGRNKATAGVTMSRFYAEHVHARCRRYVVAESEKLHVSEQDGAPFCRPCETFGDLLDA